MFPKNNFEESECLGSVKPIDEIINDFNSPITYKSLKDSNTIIVLEDSTFISMYKFGVDLFASFTEGSKGKVSLKSLGIYDEYSYHKYLNEIGAIDLVGLDLMVLVSAKIPMLVLNEIAHKHYPENLYSIEVGGERYILIQKNNSQTIYEISFFEKGIENYQVTIRTKSRPLQDEFIKKFACSAIDDFPVP